MRYMLIINVRFPVHCKFDVIADRCKIKNLHKLNYRYTNNGFIIFLILCSLRVGCCIRLEVSMGEEPQY